MHVVILNQTFHPDVAATGQLMWDLARHLDANGYRVSALTSRAFYGTDRRHASPVDYYGRIAVHRVGGTAFGKKSHIARLADFASFYAAAAWELQNLSKVDVILALTSPPLIATIALLQRQFMTPPIQPRVVYHVMDLYPDAAVAMGVVDPGSLMGITLRRIAIRAFDAADAIIALGRDMKDRIASVYHGHVDPEQIHVIPPWADGQLLKPADTTKSTLARSLGIDQTFNIVYSGNLGMAHDLETMIGAIDALRRTSNLRFIFIGGGRRSEALRSEAQRRKWEHVLFLPFQDRDDLGASLNLADVHLVSQLPSFTGLVVPSKLFGIMAVGKPCVMVGPAEAECSRIICENACGFVVPNGDPGLLVKRLLELRENPQLRLEMGRRARETFEKNYDRPIACAKIQALLCEVVERE